MRTALLSLGLALVAGCCSSSMRGVVSSSETGGPIRGAVVQVQGRTTVTDPMGFYRVQDLECDDFYGVAISAPGYPLKRTTVTAPAGAEEVLANFKLDPVQGQQPQAMRSARQAQQAWAERQRLDLEDDEEEFEVFEAATGE